LVIGFATRLTTAKPRVVQRHARVILSREEGEGFHNNAIVVRGVETVRNVRALQTTRGRA
jgi:hypothetical protein